MILLVLLGFTLWLISLIAFAVFDKIWIRLVCGLVWFISYFLMAYRTDPLMDISFTQSYLAVSPWVLLILLGIKGCWVRYKHWRSK